MIWRSDSCSTMVFEGIADDDLPELKSHYYHHIVGTTNPQFLAGAQILGLNMEGAWV